MSLAPVLGLHQGGGEEAHVLFHGGQEQVQCLLEARLSLARFNIISFYRGKVMAWEEQLVPPVAQKLREAESFVEKLQPAKRTDLLQVRRL